MATVARDVDRTTGLEDAVRSVLVDGRRRLGNVEFWVEPEGFWAGRLAYDRPTSQWRDVARDLTAALLEKTE